MSDDNPHSPEAAKYHRDMALFRDTPAPSPAGAPAQSISQDAAATARLASEEVMAWHFRPDTTNFGSESARENATIAQAAILMRHFAPIYAERDALKGEVERLTLQAEASGVIRTIDHPEANERKPVFGEQEYTLHFTKENGLVCLVKMGQAGFDITTNLLLDMLSNAPSHDDGSTSLSPYNKMRNRMESAELRAHVLQSDLMARQAALVASNRERDELAVSLTTCRNTINDHFGDLHIEGTEPDLIENQVVRLCHKCEAAIDAAHASELAALREEVVRLNAIAETMSNCASDWKDKNALLVTALATAQAEIDAARANTPKT